MSARAIATPLAFLRRPSLRSLEYRIPPSPAPLWLCEPRGAARRHPVANCRAAVAYIRVSTEEQARLDAQAERVAAYCTMAGLELVAVLREEGVSASRALTSRPKGREVLELIDAGAVGHVVALKLDRLFRDVADCLNQTRRWDDRGIALHLVDMGGQTLTTSSAMGRMFLTMTAAFAELERNLISERTAAALAHKVRQGAQLGAPPIGWCKVTGSDGKLTALAPEPHGQAALARIEALRAQGRTLRAIAEQLTLEGVPTPCGGRWNSGTLWKMLHRGLRVA
jgi:DNA invertase Pin-like site-specific DNA recombinase